MKIWVVGKNGLLGSTLVSLCGRRKLPFCATSRNEADITDVDQLIRIARSEAPTHIINCSAYTDVDGAENQPEEAFRINAEGAENLAKAAAVIDAKLIHISTNFVFDGSKSTPYVEHDSCRPLGIYAKSKWEGETRVRSAHPAPCIIRTAWLYGISGKNFISNALNLLKTKEHLKIVADEWGSPTFCEDLAQALYALRDGVGIYHYANAGGCTRYEIALEMLRICQAEGFDLKCRSIEPVQAKEFPAAAVRPKYAVLSTAKFEKKIGMPRCWQDALKEYLRAL